MTDSLEKKLENKLPWEKSPSKVFSKDMTFEDLSYLINEATSFGLRAGGICYAIVGSDPHHIRDGILIYVGGKLISYGYMGIKYLKEIYKNNKNDQNTIT